MKCQFLVFAFLGAAFPNFTYAQVCTGSVFDQVECLSDAIANLKNALNDTVKRTELTQQLGDFVPRSELQGVLLSFVRKSDFASELSPEFQKRIRRITSSPTCSGPEGELVPC